MKVSRAASVNWHRFTCAVERHSDFREKRRHLTDKICFPDLAQILCS